MNMTRLEFLVAQHVTIKEILLSSFSADDDTVIRLADSLLMNQSKIATELQEQAYMLIKAGDLQFEVFNNRGHVNIQQKE